MAGLDARAGVSAHELKHMLAKADSEMKRGDYTLAMETLYEFERLADLPDSPTTDAERLEAYSMLGRIQCLYNDFASAVLSYEKALKIKEIEPDRRVNMLASYAVSACFLGDESRARDGADKLKQVTKGDPCRKAYQIATVNGYIEKKFGDRAKSAQYFREVLSQIQRGGLPEDHKLTALSELSEYYDFTSQPDSALIYLKPYAELAGKYHSAPMIADASRGMLRAYMLRKDSVNALKHIGEYLEAVDSIYKPAQFIALNSKRQNERMAMAKSTIEDLEFTVSWQKGLIGILILCAVLAIAAIFLRKHFGHLQRQLYERNREIVKLANGPQESDKKDIEPSADVDQGERNRAIMLRIEEVLKDKSLYCDPDFSLATLAKLVQSNTKYVSQAINESTDQNFRAYINRLRIYEARKKLTDDANFGHLTIQAISESVGFRSTSNFIISFKKVTGLAPSLYIKMVREDRGL